MFEYFYHEILRKIVVSFGSLFNEIEIRKKDDSGDTFSVIKVPLAYGPTQKFLARLEQSPDLNKPVQMTLPRMSFEMNGINYDPRRKASNTQQFIIGSGTDASKAYLPVPYDINFELSIMTKLNEDMLQIVEQILPYFQPSYNLSVKLVDSIKETRDIPIVLNNINMEDSYEGDYSSRRALIYTLQFTAKTYLFGPIDTNASKDIIKKVSVGYIAGDVVKGPSRDVTYRVLPKATKDYDGDTAATLASDIELSTTIISVDDASSITEKTYIDINNETMYVKSINGNDLTVARGQYSTTISEHVSGSKVSNITTTDDALIEVGDDFGFSGDFI